MIPFVLTVGFTAISFCILLLMDFCIRLAKRWNAGRKIANALFYLTFQRHLPEDTYRESRRILLQVKEQI